MLAIRPSIYGPLFSEFNIAPGNERRLIFIVVLAVIVLFGLFPSILFDVINTASVPFIRGLP